MAALVLAVFALAVGMVPVAGDLVSLLLAGCAVGCGFRGFMRAEDGLANNPGTALTGMILGALAAVWSLVTLLVLFEE